MYRFKKMMFSVLLVSALLVPQSIMHAENMDDELLHAPSEQEVLDTQYITWPPVDQSAASELNESELDSSRSDNVTSSSSRMSLPNRVKVELTANKNGFQVHFSNAGVDAIDNVTITPNVTGYGTLKVKGGKIPAVVGKTFEWDAPAIKTLTEYKITYVLSDGKETQGGVLKGQRLPYTTAPWHSGTFVNVAASLDYHFDKHAHQVNARNIDDYIASAVRTRMDAMQNPSMYNTSDGKQSGGYVPSTKYTHKVSGVYVIVANSTNLIFSHGGR